MECFHLFHDGQAIAIWAIQNGVDGWYDPNQKFMMIVNRTKLVILDD